MNSNRVTACHHIELEDNCQWCAVYAYQSVRQCDRCKSKINSDSVFLSLRQEPQLLCVYCHYDETKWGV